MWESVSVRNTHVVLHAYANHTIFCCINDTHIKVCVCASLLHTCCVVCYNVCFLRWRRKKVVWSGFGRRRCAPHNAHSSLNTHIFASIEYDYDIRNKKKIITTINPSTSGIQTNTIRYMRNKKNYSFRAVFFFLRIFRFNTLVPHTIQQFNSSMLARCNKACVPTKQEKKRYVAGGHIRIIRVWIL